MRAEDSDAPGAREIAGRGAYLMSRHARYHSMRESHIDGLGQIPDHWTIAQLKFLARFKYGDALASDIREDDGDVPVFGSNGVVGTHNIANTKSPVVVVGRKGSFGKIVYSQRAGFCIDTAYFVDRSSTNSNLKWLYYMLGQLGLDALSQDTGVPGLSRELAHSKYVVVPPESEQNQIATFLDHETAKIDRLIARQKRLIELLKEKRQAVISHAVTKGLNPDAPMKDSGVKWLGEVPAHWEVARIKHVATLQSGVAKGRDLTDKDTIQVSYLRVANVQDGYLNLDDIAEIEIQQSELTRYLLRYGDVLMNEGGDNDKLGRGAVWRCKVEPCIHQNHVFAIRPQRVEPEWLSLVTQASYARFYFFSVAKQSTNLASISSTNIKETPVVVPPVDERNAIRVFIDIEIEKLDRLVRLAEKQISFLNEHRTALISAAVTGKIDVRGWHNPNTEPQETATAVSA